MSHKNRMQSSPYALPLLKKEKKSKLRLPKHVMNTLSYDESKEASGNGQLKKEAQTVSPSFFASPKTREQQVYTLLAREAFYSTPSLPDVDAFVTTPELHLNSMTRLIQEERKQGFQSSRKKTTRMRKKRTNRKTRKEETGSKVSTQEIDKLVQFMDELGDGDGQISPSELEAAVRVFRKASVGSSRESRGRELVVRLLEMLREIQLSVKDWFMLIDRSKDGKVQMNELKKGMADLSARLGKRSSLHFSDRDINDLLSFMDPDADGTVTGEEVIMAIKKLNMPMEDQETLARLGKTFEKLHSFMLAQRMRIVDLFSFLDQDGSKSISPEELKQGLLKIMNPTKSSQQGLASSTSRHIRTAEAKLSRHDARIKTRPHTSSSSHLERTRRIIREIKTPATSVRKGRETLLFQPLPSPASRKSTTLFQSTDISRDHIKTIDARIKECHSILKNM